MRRLLRNGWTIVMCAALVGALIGYGFILRVPPKYSTEALMYVTPPVSSSATDAAAGDIYAATRTQLYEQMSKDDELARRVAAALQTSESPAALAKRVTITASHEAPLLTIEATGRSPQEARSLAQAYLDQLPDFARSVEQSSGLRDGPVLVTVASPSTVVASPITGRPWLLIAACSGLATALALSFLWARQRRDPRLTSVDQLRKALPTQLAVELTGRPDQIARLQPMLFAAHNRPKDLIVAGVRHDDGLEVALVHLERLLRSAPYPGETSSDGPRDADLLRDEPTIVSAPALLDESQRIPALACQASTAVIMCRKHRTRVHDIVDLAAMLSRNGIELRGVLIAGRHRLPREIVPGAASVVGQDRPWPRIDALEADASGKHQR